MNYLIIAVIAVLVGIGVGWYLKGKFGTKVALAEDAVKKVV